MEASDADSVRARLRAAPTDPRERDALCEAISAELVAAEAEPPFDIASTDLDSDAFFICADRFWRRRFLADPGLETATACGNWILSRVADPWQRDTAEIWAMGFGFLTAADFGRDPLGETAQYLAHSQDQPEAVTEFSRLYQVGRARTAFRFDDVHALLLAGREESDLLRPLEHALLAFAILGSPQWTRAYAQMRAEQAWKRRAGSKAALDLLLNGLGVAHPFIEQGPLLVSWASQAVRELPNSHSCWYWLATGQHMVGHQPEASTSIAKALAHLPATGTRVSHNLLLEQYRTLMLAIRTAPSRSS
ncbi:hypothetical protein J7E91_19035 [Streptomyces sp. ISL-99]|uniref:hypothetical protein n=1 Tax=Streptomyces sp. ISL-99 TaxID=2819193 RepID=UPI001BE61D84|nr:hypothetical protein [Streptomyces sp. ISL-99]MBT2527462.1 hypothetical protein [Streptomyces sp. ISL-99]